MLAKLGTWFDHRSGYRKFLDVMLLEEIPGGARWRYVWGSTLAFVFAVQLITGVLLMTSYSAGDSTAWSSVYFIQYKMDFGWLIRGLHHFGSQAMVILLGVHMLQVVIAGAHLPPRELNWWLGLALLGCVLGLSLTGYLLPWDQKGYWATQVATNIAGNLPVAGPFVQKVVVGGPEYGHHTLTRFYALHVAVLPPLVIVLIIAHLVVFRRHGITVPLVTMELDASGNPLDKHKEGQFWPDQAFRDMVASMLVFVAMLGLVLWGHGQKVEPADAPPPAEQGLFERRAHKGMEGKGANLDAPADPGTEYPARPEWYFLFLFQLLKYFEGPQELIGTVIIPQGAGLLLALLPLLGYGRMRKFGHVVGVIVIVLLLSGAAMLTLLAMAEDTAFPPARFLLAMLGTRVVPLIFGLLLGLLGVLSLMRPGRARRVVYGGGVGLIAGLSILSAVLLFRSLDFNRQYLEHLAKSLPFEGDDLFKRVKEEMPEAERKPTEKAKGFAKDQAKAEKLAERAVKLAWDGVPADGAGKLLRRDPETRGPELFRNNCATCHAYGTDFDNADKATASDLKGFGTKDWIAGLLKDPGSPHYFGKTGLKQMTNWVNNNSKRFKEGEFDLVATWLATHPRKKPADGDTTDAARGYAVFMRDKSCSSCHSWGTPEEGAEATAPDLTGYGDADWLRMMIMSPDHASRYGKNNKMPAFRDLEGPQGEVVKQDYTALYAGSGKEVKDMKLSHLSDIDRELIIRWLLKDPRAVFGGDQVSGVGKR